MRTWNQHTHRQAWSIDSVGTLPGTEGVEEEKEKRKKKKIPRGKKNADPGLRAWKKKSPCSRPITRWSRSCSTILKSHFFFHKSTFYLKTFENIRVSLYFKIFENIKVLF
jgi:hypothetical protein